MISQFGVPFVYDDHEYWPSLIRSQVQPKKDTIKERALGHNPKRIISSLARRFSDYNYLRLVLKWQKELVSCAPTIVTSDRVASQLKVTNNTDKVFVVPNFPSMLEVKDFEKPFRIV